jgi:hypothetical protein
MTYLCVVRADSLTVFETQIKNKKLFLFFQMNCPLGIGFCFVD